MWITSGARPSPIEDLIKEMEAGFCHTDPINLAPGPPTSARKGLHLPDNGDHLLLVHDPYTQLSLNTNTGSAL